MGGRTMGESGACDTDHNKVLKGPQSLRGQQGAHTTSLAVTQLCGSLPQGESCGHSQTPELRTVPPAAFADFTITSVQPKAGFLCVLLFT